MTLTKLTITQYGKPILTRRFSTLALAEQFFAGWCQACLHKGKPTGGASFEQEEGDPDAESA